MNVLKSKVQAFPQRWSGEEVERSVEGKDSSKVKVPLICKYRTWGKVISYTSPLWSKGQITV